MRNSNIKVLFKNTSVFTFFLCLSLSNYSTYAKDSKYTATNLEIVANAADSLSMQIIAAYNLEYGDTIQFLGSLEKHNRIADYIFSSIQIALNREGVVLSDSGNGKIFLIDVVSGGVSYSKIRRSFLWIPGEVTRMVRIRVVCTADDFYGKKKIIINYENTDKFPYSKLSYVEMGDQILGVISKNYSAGWQPLFETILAGTALTVIAFMFYFIRS